MRPLRNLLDQLEPYFRKGGRLEGYQAIYEMLDTLLYSPSDVSRNAPHVRDAINLKRVMGLVVVGVLPCAVVGMWNTGYQANLAIAELGLSAPTDWRGALMAVLGIGHDPNNVAAATFYGLLYFLPIYLVTMLAGGFWEILFAGIRNHEVNEGFFVTSILYALTLPATTPLWQVAIGISFGVVIAKEVFGGTGKNFMNPALAGRAFLYFAYPVQMSGESVWVPPVDVVTGRNAACDRSGQRCPWHRRQRGDLDGRLPRPDSGIIGRDIGVGVPSRWRVHRVHRCCVVADHRWRHDRHDGDRDALQCGGVRLEPDVRHAVGVAFGARWIRVRHGVHGDRPGHRVRDQSRPLGVRGPSRGSDRGDSGRQLGFSRGNHACDPLREHLLSHDRLLRHAGQHHTEAEAKCLSPLQQPAPSERVRLGRCSWRSS